MKGHIPLQLMNCLDFISRGFLFLISLILVADINFYYCLVIPIFWLTSLQYANFFKLKKVCPYLICLSLARLFCCLVSTICCKLKHWRISRVLFDPLLNIKELIFHCENIRQECVIRNENFGQAKNQQKFSQSSLFS